ncbi:hypothetical protein [Arthrobacter sp. EpRS71]|uniref:hypothetical protein n=1 Tax=Arthrobacter sp. EpRS71 TaxID=1743141 RepID=UPI000748D6CD|nr:hypothetical protein [Arthrobacter sp. EpRS71]KUM36374.1 hypothetical protein AR689_20845 [Arthrobacter sp. EpRS71]
MSTYAPRTMQATLLGVDTSFRAYRVPLAPRLKGEEDDWTQLEGSLVEIRQAGALIRTGTVDAVTADSSMIWIGQDGALPRQLFLRADGTKVWTFHS